MESHLKSYIWWRLDHKPTTDDELFIRCWDKQPPRTSRHLETKLRKTWTPPLAAATHPRTSQEEPCQCRPEGPGMMTGTKWHHLQNNREAPLGRIELLICCFPQTLNRIDFCFRWDPCGASEFSLNSMWTTAKSLPPALFCSVPVAGLWVARQINSWHFLRSFTCCHPWIQIPFRRWIYFPACRIYFPWLKHLLDICVSPLCCGVISNREKRPERSCWHTERWEPSLIFGLLIETKCHPIKRSHNPAVLTGFMGGLHYHCGHVNESCLWNQSGRQLLYLKECGIVRSVWSVNSKSYFCILSCIQSFCLYSCSNMMQNYRSNPHYWNWITFAGIQTEDLRYLCSRVSTPGDAVPKKQN